MVPSVVRVLVLAPQAVQVTVTSFVPRSVKTPVKDAVLLAARNSVVDAASFATPVSESVLGSVLSNAKTAVRLVLRCALGGAISIVIKHASVTAARSVFQPAVDLVSRPSLLKQRCLDQIVVLRQRDIPGRNQKTEKKNKIPSRSGEIRKT